MTKKVFKVSGMHCTSCALDIEWSLEDAGVTARCSYAKQELAVEYNPEKISEEKIKQTVKNSGYDLI